MRKNRHELINGDISILTLDDDPLMTATVQSYFQVSGFKIDVENDPYRAIERVKEGSYDLLLLDFLMTPICGDQVVEQIRKFNQDIFIILLTGHKSLAPPIKTIKELDIQGYYEKSDRFDQLELLVESCVKSIRQLRTIRNYQNSTARLIDAMPQIYRIDDIDASGHKVLEIISEMLGAAGGFLMLNVSAEGEPDVRRYCLGDCAGILEGHDFKELTESFDTIIGGDKTVLHTCLYGENGRVIGVLALRFNVPPTLHQSQIFQLYAKQSSTAVSNTMLVSKINQSYYEMVKVIRLMVDAKDIITRGHSDRVAYFSGRLAEALGKDKAFCERVRTAGLFHDVGKMSMPDEILCSSRTLTPEEFEIVKQHPANSSVILSVVSRFKDIAPIVKQHHERIDGKGYPEGLSGDDILEEARVISIADAFDAMISTRYYSGSLPVAEAAQQLRQYRGTKFDAAMVDVFLDLIKDWDGIKTDLESYDSL